MMAKFWAYQRALLWRRLIGDSQASYWFLAVECFLKQYLASEFRQQPTDSIEANMWLIKYVEELPHRGSKHAEPKPAMCTVYQASTAPSFSLRLGSCSSATTPIPQARPCVQWKQAVPGSILAAIQLCVDPKLSAQT